MRGRHTKWVVFLAILIILLLMASFFSLVSGEQKISLFDLPRVLSDSSLPEHSILTIIRIPRLVLAFAIGGALSLTGAILQGVYRNPLVEPYTLGISGGAALGVALVIVSGLHLSGGIIMLPMAGFGGSVITLFVVYTLSLKRGALEINRMLLIGVMISFVASSAIMFLMSINSANTVHSIVFWMMGSLDEPNGFLIKAMLAISVSGLFVSYLFARPLNALRLGETKAMHLGVNTTTTIRILFVVGSLLVGACVSVAGVIGFVGLVIPHITRMIVGSDFRVLLLGSYLGGSIFLMVCDVVARTVISPHELPIGVITGIIGGAAFIVVLSRNRQQAKPR